MWQEILFLLHVRLFEATEIAFVVSSSLDPTVDDQIHDVILELFRSRFHVYAT